MREVLVQFVEASCIGSVDAYAFLQACLFSEEVQGLACRPHDKTIRGAVPGPPGVLLSATRSDIL